MTDIVIRSTVETNAEEARTEAQQAALQAERQIRRALLFTRLGLQVIGVTVDEALVVLTELTGNAIGTALAISATGFTLGNVGRIGHLGLLYLQYRALQSDRTKLATQLGAAEQMVDMALLT